MFNLFSRTKYFFYSYSYMFDDDNSFGFGSTYCFNEGGYFNPDRAVEDSSTELKAKYKRDKVHIVILSFREVSKNQFRVSTKNY